MKLMSMTDFVLHQRKKCIAYHSDYGRSWDYRPSDFRSVCNYADFLKQPLTLGMFVPCDEDGNVLEGPKNYELWTKRALNTYYDLDLSKYEQYQQAKERVLFEGITIGSYHDGKSYLKGITTTYIIVKNEMYEDINEAVRVIDTIENLLEYNDNITLTQSAIKQLGL